MKYYKGDQFIYATYGGTWFVGEVTSVAGETINYKILLGDKNTTSKSSVMAPGSSVYNGALTPNSFKKGNLIDFLFDTMRETE